MPVKLEATNVGIAGEYFVAAELCLRGFVAAITLRNSRGIDIVCSDKDGENTVSIQVKTNSSGSPKWILNKKAETYESSTHFYIFVALRSIGERPDFFVVPSSVVAKYVTESHREWLKGLRPDGQKRKDSNIRNFRDIDGVFKEKWDLLKLAN